MSILEIYYRHYGNVTKKNVKSYKSCNDVGAAIANRILSILYRRQDLIES